MKGIKNKDVVSLTLPSTAHLSSGYNLPLRMLLRISKPDHLTQSDTYQCPVLYLLKMYMCNTTGRHICNTLVCKIICQRRQGRIMAKKRHPIVSVIERIDNT